MNISPIEFARAFRASFVVNRAVLRWATRQQRTAHMTAYIYRTLAGCFPGAQLAYEHDGIDAVMLRGQELDVAIEHENNVLTIATELKALRRVGAPLSVLITYTGGRAEYLHERHKAGLSEFADETLLVIVNREDWLWFKHQPGEEVAWDFLLVRDGVLQPMAV